MDKETVLESKGSDGEGNSGRCGKPGKRTRRAKYGGRGKSRRLDESSSRSIMKEGHSTVS